MAQKTQSSQKESKISLDTLVAVLNPAIFVILAGGLLLGYDPVTLAIVGVVGYTAWGIMNVIMRRRRRREAMASKKGKKAAAMRKGPDYGLLASLLNPLVLVVLLVGVVQKWDIAILIAVGVAGYGLWAILNYQDRKRNPLPASGKRKR